MFDASQHNTPMHGYFDNTIVVGQILHVGNRQYAVTHIELAGNGERVAVWMRPVDFRQPIDAAELAEAIAADSHANAAEPEEVAHA